LISLFSYKHRIKVDEYVKAKSYVKLKPPKMICIENIFCQRPCNWIGTSPCTKCL